MNDMNVKKLELMASALRAHQRNAMGMGMDDVCHLLGVAELAVSDALNAQLALLEESRYGNSWVIPFPGRASKRA